MYETSCCQGAGSDGGDIGAAGVGCFSVPNVLFHLIALDFQLTLKVTPLHPAERTGTQGDPDCRPL